jgi:hypothetical protein
MEYHIELKRELSEEEKKILSHVLSNTIYSNQIDSLKIIARCGCGKCPTVLFGQSFDDAPIPNGQDVVQYQGVNSDGEIVGVTVMAAAGRLTELEASSFSGGNIYSWPYIQDLEPINA